MLGRFFMSNLRFFCALAAILFFLLATAASPTKKDHAVVIGIDTYEQLGQLQYGSVNDAVTFAKVLEDRGVQPVLLLNEQATREAILSALREGADAENLIVYYSGLGSGPNTPRLLTYDNQKGLTLEDLDRLLLTLNTAATTVVLDTCFTGSRADKTGPSLHRSRYFEPSNTPRSLVSLGANEGRIPGVSHDKICYVTASRFNEEAFEDSFSGEPRGVFSHFLCDRLDGGRDLGWQAVQWEVGPQVSAHLGGLQNPLFPTQYLANAALNGKEFVGLGYGGTEPQHDPARLPPKGSQQTTSFSAVSNYSLWTLYNIDNIEPEVLKLSMRPNQTEVKVEEPLEFEVEVGKAGYLVVVEHSVEGTLKPIFPRDGNPDVTVVRPGQRIIIPEPGVIAYADRPGMERIKALLFDDRSSAAALIAGLEPQPDIGPSFGNVSRKLQSREIRFARATQTGRDIAKEPTVSVPYTADLRFLVVPK